MRSLFLVHLGFALIALMGSTAAFADMLTPTLGQPLREVSHTVDVTIDKGIAVYKVRRVFANGGERADEAGLEIDLPYGAAATALRIRARHRWYDGELYEAEEAARLYHEMTGLGAHRVKDPALLQWMWADKLYLQVFPVLPKSTSTVEYTLTVPTRYERGKVFLSYPHVATAVGEGVDVNERPPLAKPVLTLRPAWGDATTYVVVDGARVATDTPIVLLPPVVPAWVAQLGFEGASVVASNVVVPDVPATKAPVATVTLTLDIEHTFKSDLRVHLLTPSGAQLQVFDGAGGDENDIKGTFVVKLDKAESPVGTWRLVVSDHAARDAGSVNAWSLALGAAKGAYKATATDTPVFVPDAPESANDGGTATIVMAPPPIDVVAARLGKVIASTEHAFSRLELDTAPELRPLPKNARVVFVIDASRSAGPEHIGAQLALVRGYLAHVPDAHAEIVVTRRFAAAAFGRFLPAKEVPAAIAKALEAGTFDEGNGSALDEGVRLSTKLLDGAAGSAHRIVIMTDELLRTRFQNAWVLDDLRALTAATIVHVVAPSLDHNEESHLERDDKAKLAPFASEHHGIFARIDGLPALDKRVMDAALGLVRPMQIDFFAVQGLDVSRDDDALEGGAGNGNVLREGAGVRAMVPLVASAAPDRVTLRGKIWGDAWKRTVNVDGAFSRATAAWVFGEDEHHELTDKEQLKVAFMGRAVSPVTSYLATEPGVRPSPVGIDRSSLGSGFGSGSMGSRGFGAGGGGREPVRDLRGLVDAAARACYAKHDAKGARKVSLDAETTYDEIVDVIAPAGTEREPLTACLVEAVWAVRLPSAFDEERDTFPLAFP